MPEEFGRAAYSSARSATSATFVAASPSDNCSPVVNPEREASIGLTSRNASNVVPCATGMTRLVASRTDSSLSAMPAD